MCTSSVGYSGRPLLIWVFLVVQDLMTLGFDNMVLLLSSYCDPVATIEHARRQGYRVTDFMVTPLPFGYYSSEPKVRLRPSCYADMRDHLGLERSVVGSMHEVSCQAGVPCRLCSIFFRLRFGQTVLTKKPFVLFS